MAIRKPSRPAPRRMTAREYFALPETMTRQDLIDGELTVAPSPAWHHQEIVLAVAVALQAFAVRDGGRVILSPMDVELAPDTVLQPDVGYICRDGAARVGRHVVGPPDLVVEVLSPGTRPGAADRKVELYARHGVREAWVIDPAARTTAVLANEAGAWRAAAVAPFGSPIPSEVAAAGAAGLGEIEPTGDA